MGSVTAWSMAVQLRRSLRTKVAVGMVLLSIAVVGSSSVLTYFVTDSRAEREINAIGSEELASLIRQFEANSGFVPPRTHRLSGYVARNDAERAALPSYLQPLGPGRHELMVGEKEFHIFVGDSGPARLYLSYDVWVHERQIRKLKELLMLAVVLAAALAAVLGYWLSGLLTRPVSHLADRVDGLVPGEHEAPLAEGYADAEVKRLARAFDGYLGKMAEFVEREQEFTANASHELRTPLTSIRTSCELLCEDRHLSESSRARVEKIRRAAERMSALIDSLLLLARSRHVVEPEHVALRECVEEVIEPLREEAAAKGLDLQVEIPAHVLLYADRQALTIVLTNLVKNAVKNTQRGHVGVRLRERSIEVEDSGPGIDETELQRVFERFYRGSTASAHHDGFGLGLAIVKRTCEQLGWGLVFQSHPGRGTMVRIAFPSDSISSQKLHV